MDGLYEKLTNLKEQDQYPMHMPGHKRNTALCRMGNPYELDITEIPGFDNLHQPEELLLSLSMRLSRLYGSGRAYPLVNGSTAGILAGISAAVNRGDKVLLGRNAHKSVYHAIILMGLLPVYLYPQKNREIPLYCGIPPEMIEETLITNPEIRLVILTSPTYEGVVSDIRSIAEVTHRHGALLLIDEAHGAHFGFHPYFPESAVRQGADLVIQSLHKTLPAFTQTAVLHSNISRLNHRLEQYLAVYESSSPSYILMAGIDQCVRLLEEKAGELFDEYVNNLDCFYGSMKNLKQLKLMCREMIENEGVFARDFSKIIVYDREKAMSGHRLYQLLREKYHIILEMEAPGYVLAMTSICDTSEGYARLERALSEIDQELCRERKECRIPKVNRTEPEMEYPIQAMSPEDAWNKPSTKIEFDKSTGRISREFLCLFPPGSPVLVPGELISTSLIKYITQVKQEGISVTGLIGPGKMEIEVVE